MNIIKIILFSFLFMPLCLDGEYEQVKLFADAQMDLYACGADINEDGYPDIILIYAGKPKHRGGRSWMEGLIKIMMPHEFSEALENDGQEP